ncbi:DUF3093 domain-containing protein [Pseudarthrobacter sp. J75]|uniref:DUF3093 domain-containing protein n=1 Tax=unclassified Pseudarthrobacter TaxID=2647000 RepID=UPI002E8063DE|nr:MULTISPECIES: DUF3093 domain-containing protein [unclassified Pseudarthrobacter]MEE2522705.1 DUF3093 domain-containing protein [Pseudarthrobacter sp. J47]MEE2529566.1 DUF3093 domain-containing protein [Pseudarthrobacter sp. J75]MEE2569666.1 DUF3093 domain-containing protein [Pseudarthrobacter sp. J64]
MPESSPASPLPSDQSPDRIPGKPVFDERLLPSLWIWLFAVGFSGAGILVFAPISIEAGFIAAAVLLVIVSTLLLLSTPRITVTDTELTVGRATISREYISGASAHRGPDATRERGTGLNALAYLCIRGWIDPVVRIEISDPADRTPYWLASSRRPDELVKALQPASRG